MFIEVEHIAKSFGGRPVLSDINLSLGQHETMSVLGKSGCGKSTLLKIIAGIEKPDKGAVKINGTDVTSMNPERRNIVYLFQEALLFPHLSIFENIAFGLRIRKMQAVSIKQKVNGMLQSLGIEEHAAKMPHQLSGGQKQRVAFGRALIINPPLLLLDEPFSNLDIEIRAQMQELYKSIAAKYSITALFVTHDIKEALIMGNRIAYMQDGLLKTYASKGDFINDEMTGVKKEISFWNNL